MYVEYTPEVDKMQTEVLPVIAKTDYDLWRDMIPALLATYAEWLLQHACALSAPALPEAAEIAITPAEFHHYWQVHGSAGKRGAGVPRCWRAASPKGVPERGGAPIDRRLATACAALASLTNP
jgi:hypothetical protein